MEHESQWEQGGLLAYKWYNCRYRGAEAALFGKLAGK